VMCSLVSCAERHLNPADTDAVAVFEGVQRGEPPSSVQMGEI